MVVEAILIRPGPFAADRRRRSLSAAVVALPVKKTCFGGELKSSPIVTRDWSTMRQASSPYRWPRSFGLPKCSVITRVVTSATRRSTGVVAW
jgi:hypothetical protein